MPNDVIIEARLLDENRRLKERNAEMLAALKGCRDALDMLGGKGAVRTINAVIAKADEETPK